MLDLGIILGLVLLSALATLVAAYRRPQVTHFLALGGLALICFSWLVARTSLPLSLTVGAETPPWPAWSWRVGPNSWPISLAIIFLSLGTLALAVRRRRGIDRADVAFIQIIASTALLACWADSLATHVLTWTILAVFWILGASVASDDGHPPIAVLSRLAVTAFAPVLILWFAAASAGPGADMAKIGAWPTLTRALVLLAGSWQLGLFAFQRWPSDHSRRLTTRLPLLHAAPAAAGAVLLARLEAASQIGLAFALPFTLVGLLMVLVGAYRAWMALHDQRSLALALVQAQVGLVLLAGIWVGPQAVLAEALVLILAGGILLLDMNRERLRRPLIPQPGAIIAIAALAALPLTSGFTGRAALYDAWLQDGRWLLVLVTALLHVPLLTALLTAYVRVGASSETAPEDQPSAPDRARVLALLLPALGLFSIAALSQPSALSWLALLLPVLLAAFLTWRVVEPGELSQTMSEAIALPPALSLPPTAGLRRAAAILTDAAREALLVLEGEGGLLWVLLFVIILYLV